MTIIEPSSSQTEKSSGCLTDSGCPGQRTLTGYPLTALGRGATKDFSDYFQPSVARSLSHIRTGFVRDNIISRTAHQILKPFVLID